MKLLTGSVLVVGLALERADADSFGGIEATMEATIEGGAGSMSATPLSSFREFDRDHELFFVFVRSAGITFLVMTLLLTATALVMATHLVTATATARRRVTETVR